MFSGSLRWAGHDLPTETLDAEVYAGPRHFIDHLSIRDPDVFGQHEPWIERTRQQQLIGIERFATSNCNVLPVEEKAEDIQK